MEQIILIFHFVVIVVFLKKQLFLVLLATFQLSEKFQIRITVMMFNFRKTPLNFKKLW